MSNEVQTGSTVSAKWEELKSLVTELEKDVAKNAEKHNCSAGTRVRVSMRALVKLAKSLSRELLEADKAVKAARKAEKAKA
jgi:hypothetical protein